MSIFDEGNKLTSDYFKFTNVGDKVEWTYIDRRVTVNKLKNNEEQIVYTLKTPDGEVTDVYGKAGIDAQMRNVKLGQIIGFEFIESKPAKQAGYNDTKIIQVYANPKIVDELWMKGIDGVDVTEAMSSGTAPVSESAPAQAPATPAVTPAPAAEVTPAPAAPSATADLEEVIKEINNLAISKLGATTPEDVKTKAMDATGLAFIEGNLPQMLELLKAMK